MEVHVLGMNKNALAQPTLMHPPHTLLRVLEVTL